jgi:signal peptide peptidase SppA
MQGRGSNKIAVIPIQGVLTKDGPAWYGSNYDGIVDAAEKAAADPDVRRIVLAVDSPGGEVTGCPETAAALAQIAKTKQVSAVVEGCCASAAYWLTSQASDITLTPSGEVGSVGVRMMHVDVSKAIDDAGIKITELSSGDHKTEWSPYKPLSEDAKADMQPRLDAVHSQFIQSVTQGRMGRVSMTMTCNRMGEGRMFSGRDALKHGLVDKLQSSREAYRGMTQAPQSPSLLGAHAHYALPVQADDCDFQRARLELERRRF